MHHKAAFTLSSFSTSVISGARPKRRSVFSWLCEQMRTYTLGVKKRSVLFYYFDFGAGVIPLNSGVVCPCSVLGCVYRLPKTLLRSHCHKVKISLHTKVHLCSTVRPSVTKGVSNITKITLMTMGIRVIFFIYNTFCIFYFLFYYKHKNNAPCVCR